jgi:23S rRNA (pseudouridine1915-N3)-methyltransferase
MRILVAAVGRERSPGLDELAERYCRRCAWPVTLAEIAPQRVGPLARRLAEEGARLLKAVPAEAVPIALDERGEALDSLAFARRLETLQQAGARSLAFLIGGADGLDPAARERTRLVLSLGPMTWPHRLARLMLLEQLYRAGTILGGHPYHRDGG